MRDDTTDHSRFGRPGTRPQVRARLSSLTSLAAATGHDLPVVDAPAEEAAPTRPQIHVALGDVTCRQRVAMNASRFGWDIVEHVSAAALLTALQADLTPPALVVIDSTDASAVRAVGPSVPLLVVRTADVEVITIGEDENTKIAAADCIGRALIDVAGRLRARTPSMAPAQRPSAPMLRSSSRTAPPSTTSTREAS